LHRVESLDNLDDSIDSLASREQFTHANVAAIAVFVDGDRKVEGRNNLLGHSSIREPIDTLLETLCIGLPDDFGGGSSVKKEGVKEDAVAIKDDGVNGKRPGARHETEWPIVARVFFGSIHAMHDGKINWVID
jgi:hypothetical protein